VKRLAFVFFLTAAVTCELQAHEGWGIVRDKIGNIYITDIPANTVWRISPDGRIEAVMRNTHSHALVVDSNGTVFGTDVEISEPVRSVWRIDPPNRTSSVVSPSRGQPLDLQAFLIGRDGIIYSSTPFEFALSPSERSLYIVRRLPSGPIDSLAGGRKGFADGKGRAAMFSSIDGMAWISDSAFLVVDGAHLRRVSLNGEVATLAKGLTTLSWDQDIMGVSALNANTFYVADFAGRRVLEVKGRQVSVVDRTGWYWSPTGVFADSSGIYTLEHPRAPLGILGDLQLSPYLRVRVLRADGSRETLGTISGRYVWALIVVPALIILSALLMIRRYRYRQAQNPVTD
jgi:hypothetical protein